jgi:hypothetical protein
MKLLDDARRNWARERQPRSGTFGRREIAHGASVPRLGGAFCGVGVSVDHLEVWQAPITEQLRPLRIPVFAPYPKQRDSVVDLGGPPESSAGLATAARLEAPQQAGLVTRRIPELPGNDAGAMPICILVGTAIPQINMPAKAINRLPAHAAETWALRVCVFAIRRGRRSKGGWQSAPAVFAKPPGPPVRRSAAGSKRAGQTISAKWMRPPVGIYREPGSRRHERAAECSRQYVRRKVLRQGLRQTGQRIPISFLLLV